MFQYKKTVQALAYLCNESGVALHPKKVLSWLFLADIAHAREHGRTITEDIYVATGTGFSLVSTEALLNHVLFDQARTKEGAYCASFLELTPTSIAATGKLDLSEFSESDEKFLSATYYAFHSFSSQQLGNLIRTFPEWKAAKVNEPVSLTAFLAGASELVKNRAHLHAEADIAFSR